MSRDRGRLVVHFGKEYIWIVNERGRLQLVALSAMLETVRAAADVLKAPAWSTQQRLDTWAVSR